MTTKARSARGRINRFDPVARDHPLNRGLVAWWLGLPHLAGGARLYDLVGSRHASLVGAPFWSRAGAFVGLSLDGSTGYASFPQITSLDFPFTMSAWIYPTDATHYNGLIGLSKPGDSVARITLEIRGSAEGNVAAVASYNDSGEYRMPVTTAPVTINAWNHVVAVLPSPTAATVYLNGGNAGSVTGGYAAPALSGLTVCALGCLPYTTPVLLAKGRLSDCSIWSRALSASEVAQLYAESRVGYPNLLRRRRTSIPAAALPLVAGTASFLASGPGDGAPFVEVQATAPINGSGAGPTYQWERSTDGGAYSDLTGATSLVLTDTTAVEGYLYSYRCKQTRGTDTVTTNAVVAEIYPGGVQASGQLRVRISRRR